MGYYKGYNLGCSYIRCPQVGQDPKYLLVGTRHLYVKVQGGSLYVNQSSAVWAVLVCSKKYGAETSNNSIPGDDPPKPRSP